MAEEVANGVLEFSVGLAPTAVLRTREAVVNVRAGTPPKVVDTWLADTLAHVEVLPVDNHPLHALRLATQSADGM